MTTTQSQPIHSDISHGLASWLVNTYFFSMGLSDAIRIARLIASANGSSQPWYGVLEDGTFWLLKFAGAGPGVDALLAEYIANGLGRLWGLPIAESKPAYLDESVPRVGTDEFWDVLAASEGWNLAIRTISNVVDVIPSTDLPKSMLELMLTYDALLANWDRTVLSRNLLQDESGTLWWIDQGSCRFLHNLRSRQRHVLPENHFLFAVQDQFEPQPLPMLTRSSIEDLLVHVPTSWLAATGYNHTSLSSDLYDFLYRELASR